MQRMCQQSATPRKQDFKTKHQIPEQRELNDGGSDNLLMRVWHLFIYIGKDLGLKNKKKDLIHLSFTLIVNETLKQSSSFDGED